jgi:CheY-like chemotaxis protein
MTMPNELPRILLVEDNEGDIELIRRAFQREHFRCELLIARNGDDAISIMRKDNSLTLVLLDINLPGMDGFDVLRQRMREDYSLQDIPVVMCSSSNYRKDMGISEELGAQEYVVKPVQSEKLKNAIRLCPDLEVLEDEGSWSVLRRTVSFIPASQSLYSGQSA